MPWLCGIAVNVVRESRRRERRKTLFLRAVWQEASTKEAFVDDAVDGGGSDREQAQLIADAMVKLPDRQREAIACRYLRRMSVRETAVAMGCAEGTVKSAVSAALETLREVLKDCHER
jgi:RNA polymerase sigma factor (sigma-70 family)